MRDPSSGQELKALWVRSSPSRTRCSTASAARETSMATSVRAEAGKLLSRKSAGSWRPGGRPTPIRTRKKSPVPSERRIAFSPLWPLSPPPDFPPSRPGSMSSSAWATARPGGAGLLELVVAQQSGHGPAGLVHVRARLGQDQTLLVGPGRTDADIGGLGPDALRRREPGAVAARQLVDDQVPDVVPVPGVGRA